MVVMMQAIIFARHHQETRLFLILHHKSHPLHTQRARIPLIEFWILYSTFSTRGATDDDEDEDDGDWDVLWKVSPISLSALAYPRPSVQQPILLKLPFSCSPQKLFSVQKLFKPFARCSRKQSQAMQGPYTPVPNLSPY